MLFQESIKTDLTKCFEDEKKSALSLLDDYLAYEPSDIAVQKALDRKKYELFGYISCLDDLGVFEDAELDKMFEQVEDDIYPKQKALETRVFGNC